jgi:putative tryptophan/tyrosine transport system substrate-binding protein
MRRRNFLAGAATLGAVLPSLAQTGGAIRRIGVLGNNPPSLPVVVPLWAAFLAGLHERGWVEGRNLSIEGRWVAGRTERFAEFAAELVALDVEVIVVLGGSQATGAAKQATSKIPVVFAGISNPVENGFVDSLARPGGNVTGVSNQLGDLTEKQVELLRTFAPSLQRLGMIWEPSNPGSAEGHKDLNAAAPRLGLSVVSLPLSTPGDVERVFALSRETRPQALVVQPTPIVGRVYKEVAAFAIAERLPTITGNSVFAREGLLMSYGPDIASIWRLTAHYIDQLLHGAKAADLPVQQPTRFELVLNLRTARALGKEPPDTLLARADEVIE